MTLLVGITIPSRALNPKRRPIRFGEPGVIIAADTRFSYPSGSRPVDDAQKLWPIGDRALGGYAGDVKVAECALQSAYTATRHHRLWDDLDFVAKTVRTYLRFWHDEYSRRRGVQPTTVLLAIAPPRGRARLYRLSSGDRYRLRQRTGVEIAGSGTAAFERAFPREVDGYTRQWAASARSGYDVVTGDGGPVLEPRTTSAPFDVSLLDVVNLVVATVDLVVTKEGIPTVGGWTQVITLSAGGMAAPRARMSSDDVHWRDATRHVLQGQTEIAGGSFDAPFMDERGRLDLGSKFVIRLSPGSITGRRQTT